MNLNKGFYIINFVDSSFITYYSDKNFYFSKKYVDQYDLYMKFKKTDNFYIINEHNLLQNIKEELMQLHVNKENEIFIKELQDNLIKDKIIS